MALLIASRRKGTAVYHNKIAVSSRENLFFRKPETTENGRDSEESTEFVGNG